MHQDDWNGQGITGDTSGVGVVVPPNAVSVDALAVSAEEMWNLSIQRPNDNPDGLVGQGNLYLDRPGEPDCMYYLRTGLCGYGVNCRFNHPTYTGQVYQYRGEPPVRAGQPDCQYFLKTKTCKFGATCKYNHPLDRQNAEQIQLNILGLPMRQDEKSCPFYMRTWSCKFGNSCKFHHPHPHPSALPSYGSVSSSAGARTGLPYVDGVQVSAFGPLMQGSQNFMPVVLPSQPGWNTYLRPMGSSGYATQYPGRPDQPDCQYFMKTGTCKFGFACKYNHPKEMNAPLIANSVGPLGLPLRPGQPICTSYSSYGVCRFGSACKFDHPLYGLTLPTLSVMDAANLSYQSSSVAVIQSLETVLPSTIHDNSDRNSLGSPHEIPSPEPKANSTGDQYD